jgi:hypothetical protein
MPIRRAITGALIGGAIGLLVLAAVFGVAVHCLPYRISSPTQPWPAFCADPAYSLITYLAFPVNVISNDLSEAIYLAPLSLLTYATLGALIGSAFGASCSRAK